MYLKLPGRICHVRVVAIFDCKNQEKHPSDHRGQCNFRCHPDTYRDHRWRSCWHNPGWSSGSASKGSVTDQIPSPPYQRTPSYSKPKSTPQIDFISLLGQSRRGARVAAMMLDLGINSEHPLNPAGAEICFVQHGIHFIFNEDNVLDKVVFFAGSSDDHAHPYSYTGKLPLNLRFDQIREEAGEQVDNHEHRHLKAELGTGEWDKFEMEGYRLYLRFGEFNGRKLIREVQIVRPEDHQLAAR